MKLQIDLTGEQATALFKEATKDFTPAELERVEFHGTRRRDLIRSAILRRMP